MFVLPMASLGELQAQQALLKQELAKMSAAKKVAAKKLKRSQGETNVARLLHDAGSANTAPKLAKGVAPELLLLLEFSGIHNSGKGSSATDVLTSYVLGQGRPQQCRNHSFTDVWDKDVRANVGAGAELLFIHADDSLVIPGQGNSSDPQMTRLAKYIIEYKLFFWLLKQNCSKGVLPAPSNLMMQASEFIPGMVPDRIRTGLRKYFLNSESTTARHWMESFKERWGVEAAIAETGQDVDPDIGDFQVPWLPPVGPFLGSLGNPFFVFLQTNFNFGTNSGSHFWVRFWYPKLGLRMGF